MLVIEESSANFLSALLLGCSILVYNFILG